MDHFFGRCGNVCWIDDMISPAVASYRLFVTVGIMMYDYDQYEHNKIVVGAT